MFKLLAAGLIILTLISICFVIKIFFKKKIHIWLPSYINQKISYREDRSSKPIHILFCLVDHYEPGNGGVERPIWHRRVDEWLKRYPKMASQFVDSDGFHPRHTWFYPPHYYEKNILEGLVNLCGRCFGEIEMHLHHNRMEPFPDTEETLRNKILKCIEDYSVYGIFKTSVDGRPVKRYAFIHGDWALDNGRRDPEFCGINNEISILLETGCYADFTFPAVRMDSQPRIINSIYYAVDDPERPKSYDTGLLATVGEVERKGLLMVQGPLGIRLNDRKKGIIPSIEDAEISESNLPTNKRVDFWVDTGIHVKKRPEWIIIKLHTHGAPETQHETLLGDPIKRMHQYLLDKYNDGKDYKLHYVTARELYNIIKAAEAGKNDDPGNYRNYIFSPYLYNV